MFLMKNLVEWFEQKPQNFFFNFAENIWHFWILIEKKKFNTTSLDSYKSSFNSNFNMISLVGLNWLPINVKKER
jgi:hypothetical protein